MKSNRAADNLEVLTGLVMISLGIGLLVFAPLFALWGWNQLFGDIKMFEYTFWNWLAVFGISMVFKTYVSRDNSK